MDYTELVAALQAAGDNEEERNRIVAELSQEDLDAARDGIRARMDELDPAVDSGDLTDEQLAEIEALGATHRQLRNEADTREQAASARTEAARGVRDEITGGSQDEPEETPEGDQPSGDPEGPAEGAPEEVPEGEREPVTAAGRPELGRVSGRGRQVPTQTRPTNTRGTRVITAAADTGFAEGRNLDATELARAFDNRLRAVARARGTGQPVHVATIAVDGPAERRLRINDPAGNTARIEQFAGRGAITAAGGLCAPFTPDYTVQTVGSTARPVRDALAGFQVDRGGLMFRPPLSIADAPMASGVWTNDMDEAVDAEDPDDRPDPKPYAILECPDMITAEVEAETFQLEISNVTSRFDPAATAAQIQIAEIAHARWSENRLLRKLAAGSVDITWDQKLGALRDILAMLDQVIAYKRSVERLDETVALRMIAPAWLQNMLRVDILRALHTSNDQYFSVPDALIARWFADRNVNITWHLDGETAAGTNPAVVAQAYGLRVGRGQAVPEFPRQLDALLFTEGEWLHLDGGELDLGVVRDSELIGKNRYRTFREEWVQAVFRGIESLRIIADLVPNGASAGTVEPVPAVAAVGG